MLDIAERVFTGADRMRRSRLTLKLLSSAVIGASVVFSATLLLVAQQPPGVVGPIALHAANPRVDVNLLGRNLVAIQPGERTFTERYCVGCHSDRVKTGGLSLEGLTLTDIPAHGEIWEKVLRKLRSGEMEPLPAGPRTRAGRWFGG